VLNQQRADSEGGAHRTPLTQLIAEADRFGVDLGPLELELRGRLHEVDGRKLLHAQQQSDPRGTGYLAWMMRLRGMGEATAAFVSDKVVERVRARANGERAASKRPRSAGVAASSPRSPGAPAPAPGGGGLGAVMASQPQPPKPGKSPKNRAGGSPSQPASPGGNFLGGDAFVGQTVSMAGGSFGTVIGYEPSVNVYTISHEGSLVTVSHKDLLQMVAPLDSASADSGAAGGAGASSSAELVSAPEDWHAEPSPRANKKARAPPLPKGPPVEPVMSPEQHQMQTAMRQAVQANIGAKRVRTEARVGRSRQHHSAGVDAS
jgi:hypothetical protein